MSRNQHSLTCVSTTNGRAQTSSCYSACHITPNFLRRKSVMKNKIISRQVVFSILIAVAINMAQAQTNPPASAGEAPPAGRGVRGGFGARGTPAPWVEQGYDDHQNMMNQLGIKALRPGKSGNNQTGAGFEEATANDFMQSMTHP